MSECLFVLKSLFITVIFVALLQIQWGGSSLEDKASWFLHDSSMGHQLQGVASGVVKVGHDGISKFKVMIGLTEAVRHDEKKEFAPIRGRMKFEANRSKEYLDRKREAASDND